MRLTINSQAVTVSTAATMGEYWQAMKRQQFSDIWLDESDNGPALAMLVNGERAWLLYLRDHEGDPGLSSRNPHYEGSPDAHMEFILDNGQLDLYPISWTLTVEKAIAACEYFVATSGGRSPDILWHDNATADETQRMK